ncbi:hypothetical protein KO361_05685 [Candidatus Woesearchaeota archaeon]|nr:hypothetical protein [Candidatus Woesearchaeota archaeon]
MGYYYEIKKPEEFRYSVISSIKECLLLQGEHEKLVLIRQAKKDLFNEITKSSKELEELTKALEQILTPDELTQGIKQSIEREQRTTKKEYDYEETIKPKKINEELKRNITKTRTLDLLDFEYTLQNIEKKLADIKRN